MDFKDSPEEAQFRAKARAFLDAHAERKKGPRDNWQRLVKSEAEAVELAKKWQRTLHDNGWACLHWPKEYGGQDASAI
ncbi:MAG TPA: acyl-CoA dehydrogenase family protein, partial [Pseudomonadales bacterium]|nr:acyl-CoA dehydrogenase family protein [Pseudomonadales bacterium]